MHSDELRCSLIAVRRVSQREAEGEGWRRWSHEPEELAASLIMLCISAVIVPFWHGQLLMFRAGSPKQARIEGGAVKVTFFVIGYVVTWFLAGVAIQAAVMLS